MPKVNMRPAKVVLSLLVFVVGGLMLIGWWAERTDSTEGSDSRRTDTGVKQNTGTAPETDDWIRRSYIADRKQFQRQLPTLQHPSSNLVWYPNQPGFMLVTPYGPCILRTGSSVLTIHATPNNPRIPSQLMGPFSTEAIAIDWSERYCHEWYLHSPHAGVSPDDLWFAPETEDNP
jgi:hypothetical protein